MGQLTKSEQRVAAEVLLANVVTRNHERRFVYDQLAVRFPEMPSLNAVQRVYWGFLELGLTIAEFAQSRDADVINGTIKSVLSRGPDGDKPAQMYDQMRALIEDADLSRTLADSAETVLIWYFAWLVCGFDIRTILGLVRTTQSGPDFFKQAAKNTASSADNDVRQRARTIPQDESFWKAAAALLAESTLKAAANISAVVKGAGAVEVFAFGQDPQQAPSASETPSTSTRGNCFVATAVFEGENRAPVKILRRFRDERLARTFLGRVACIGYQVLGPVIARLVVGRPRARRLARRFLATVCWKILRGERRVAARC
jgi:hypothetical protein